MKKEEDNVGKKHKKTKNKKRKKKKHVGNGKKKEKKTYREWENKICKESYSIFYQLILVRGKNINRRSNIDKNQNNT